MNDLHCLRIFLHVFLRIFGMKIQMIIKVQKLNRVTKIELTSANGNGVVEAEKT